MTGPGAGWLRRAGRLETGGGETVLWSVAEGRRGRRWRSVRRDRLGNVLSDLLLELDGAGRWARLELATAAGILTLHPDPEGRSVHGNVVTEHGVLPLAFAWSQRHRLVVAGEPAARVALSACPGDHEPGPGLLVDVGLVVRQVDELEPGAEPGGGLPGPSWPLEVE